MTTVCMSGCFDLFHNGHRAILRKAIKLVADTHGELIVAVNTDISVESLKGEGRPVHKYSLRSQNVAKFIQEAGVTVIIPKHRVVPFTTEKELRFIYDLFEPDLILHGNDITNITKVTGHEKYTVALMPRSPNYSTTEEIEKRDEQANKANEGTNK